WQITHRTSNGALLRLDLTDGTSRFGIDLPRRAPEAQGVVPGARVNLRPEAGTIFPGPRTLPPQAAATEFPRKEKSL
ncbi:sulfate ABC transporter ATP-binding protein, partial [Paracoccus sp. PXZ]